MSYTIAARILTDYDIAMVRAEYDKINKSKFMPSYEKVDSIVSGLKFFAPLSKVVRVNLLKAARLIHYPSGTTIFKQGDYGDIMYILLKGSVNVRTKKHTSFGVIEDVISTVLYDGSHFGEYSMMKTGAEQNSPQKVKEAPVSSPQRGESYI